MPTRMTVDQIIGDRVRKARWERKLTLDQLAKKIDVIFNTLHKLELGQQKMTVQRLIQIATALQMPLSHFLDGLDRKEGKHEHRSAESSKPSRGKSRRPG